MIATIHDIRRRWPAFDFRETKADPAGKWAFMRCQAITTKVETVTWPTIYRVLEGGDAVVTVTTLHETAATWDRLSELLTERKRLEAA